MSAAHAASSNSVYLCVCVCVCWLFVRVHVCVVKISRYALGQDRSCFAHIITLSAGCDCESCLGALGQRGPECCLASPRLLEADLPPKLAALRFARD